MKNRFVAVALAVLVAGSLTACSSGSKTPETQAKETQAPETQAPETQAPETQAAETQAPETQAPVAAAAETEAAVAETEAAAAETEAPAAETELAAAETEAESADKAVYTIYNETGEAVTSISFYDNSAKKMVVKLSEPLADGDSVEVAIDQDDTATPDTTYAFSFQTEGGYVAVYKGLHYGTTPMTLIPADEKTGPVPFLYSAPDAAAETEAETEADTEASTEA